MMLLYSFIICRDSILKCCVWLRYSRILVKAVGKFWFHIKGNWGSVSLRQHRGKPCIFEEFTLVHLQSHLFLACLMVTRLKQLCSRIYCCRLTLLCQGTWFSYDCWICFSLVGLAEYLNSPVFLIKHVFYLGDLYCYPITAVASAKFFEWTS